VCDPVTYLVDVRLISLLPRCYFSRNCPCLGKLHWLQHSKNNVTYKMHEVQTFHLVYYYRRN